MATRTPSTARPPAGATRLLRRAAPAGDVAPDPLPLDVRLMNAATAFIAALMLAGVAWGTVQWLTRSPVFTLQRIELAGDLQRNSVPTIRANAAPQLQGNFFAVDLQAAQAAFQAVPWVRHAVVRRVWPDSLRVVLEEHRVAALWEGASAVGTDSGDDNEPAIERLVNTHGEVFDANLGEVEDDGLPVLSGPDGSAPAALALYRRLAPTFGPLGVQVQRVAQTARGSWRLRLDNGAVIELGRGTEDLLVARTERFVRTLTQVTARWNAPLQYADLRHGDGYAVRLAGVGTQPAAVAGAAPSAAPGPARAAGNN